jgi:hypothetical protein
MVASLIYSVMAKEACEYVALKVAEWEENPFFQGIKAYLFSGGLYRLQKNMVKFVSTWRPLVTSGMD